MAYSVAAASSLDVLHLKAGFVTLEGKPAWNAGQSQNAQGKRDDRIKVIMTRAQDLLVEAQKLDAEVACPKGKSYEQLAVGVYEFVSEAHKAQQTAKNTRDDSRYHLAEYAAKSGQYAEYALDELAKAFTAKVFHKKPAEVLAEAPAEVPKLEVGGAADLPEGTSKDASLSTLSSSSEESETPVLEDPSKTSWWDVAKRVAKCAVVAVSFAAIGFTALYFTTGMTPLAATKFAVVQAPVVASNCYKYTSQVFKLFTSKLGF